MASQLYVEDVQQFFDTTSSSYAIQLHISMLASIDSQLDELGLDPFEQQLLKLNTIAHLLTMAEGGQVKSESDMDGASASYNVNIEGQGFSATTFGQTAQGMRGFDVISDLFDKPKRFAGAV
ncbi:MAG: hypothetical protein ABNH21_06585 [Glaciecola sp.]|jgi:hypothetical protein